MIKMLFSMKRLTFVILVIFQYYGVNSEILAQTPEENPPPAVGYKVSPLVTAGYIVQQVTNPMENVGQIYYFKRTDEILYTNRVLNGTISVWSTNKEKGGSYYFNELSNEIITAIIPFKEDTTKFMIVLNLTLRILTKNETDYSLSEPVITFDQPNFEIHAAYCDPDGIMFVLLTGKNSDNNNLGKLYKIQNKQAELVKDFTTMPGDFRFDQYGTVMYMVNHYGKKITKFEYNNETRELGDAKDVFNMNDHPHLKNHRLTSVAPDEKVGHLWVAAAGNTGYVANVNPKNNTLISITPVPTKDLTFLSFGYELYKRIFVGSKSSCAKGNAQGAIYTIAGYWPIGTTSKPVDW